MTRDLDRPDLVELDWSKPQRVASLSAVFDHAVGLARTAEAWYASKRPAKKRCGRALRLGALVLGATALVLPILGEISRSQANSAPIAPGWTAIALALAAGLITLDHYFGFSSGWMRFMATELRLTRLRHAFEHDWNAQQVSNAEPPTDDQVNDLLALARAMVLAVDDLLAEETGRWIAEFRGVLERAERTLESPTRP
jgi:hypothetical protein